MDDSPPRSPVRPDEVERKFAETLREAAWIFEKEKDGRFRGSIMACEAVIGFIKARQSNRTSRMSSRSPPPGSKFSRVNRIIPHLSLLRLDPAGRWSVTRWPM
jgi:hypothetical protein